MAQAARLNLRMQKELKLLLTDPPPGVSIVPPGNEGSSMSLSAIEARIAGPEGTAYFGGTFIIRIQIPDRYPFQPPNVTFVTPIYHPNIDNGGRICLDILNLPPKGAWQPSLNISTMLTSIGLLLGDPNPDDGLMCEVSREYKYNRSIFDQKARSWTEKYAKAEFSESKIESCTMVMSSNEAHCEPSEKNVEDLLSEVDTSRKKIRVAGERLSLRSVAATEKSSHDNKESTSQSRRLSLSHSQNANRSVPAMHEMHTHEATFEEHPVQNRALQTVNEGTEQKKCLETIEAAIVSDSEESEEENERPGRKRLSLFRKRRTGEGRASWRR